MSIKPVSSEDIIADVLGRAPDVQLGAPGGGWRLSRWRQFVGSYALPSFPDPVFTVHIGGKPRVKVWERDGWSEASSVPGCASLIPAGRPTRWLVDGELDVVTLSIASEQAKQSDYRRALSRMRFAFGDPLGVALTRQILAELYAPAADDRAAYVGALANALRCHVLRGAATAQASQIPSSESSGYRIHRVLHEITEHPGEHHSVEALAALAGISPAHFSRVFRRATGVSPHRFLLEARINRAKELLTASSMSLTILAEALGFASQSHFTRTFRALVGVPPSTFRRTGMGGVQ